MTFSKGEMCACGLIRVKAAGEWRYDYSETVQRFWIITNSGKQYVGAAAFILIAAQHGLHLPVGKVKNFVSRSEVIS
jgi:hypothetical protein